MYTILSHVLLVRTQLSGQHIVGLLTVGGGYWACSFDPHPRSYCAAIFDRTNAAGSKGHGHFVGLGQSIAIAT